MPEPKDGGEYRKAGTDARFSLAWSLQSANCFGIGREGACGPKVQQTMRPFEWTKGPEKLAGSLN